MRMVEQNGGKFRRLKKRIKKSLLILVKIKKKTGNVIPWRVDLNEKIKKIVMGTLNLKNEPEKTLREFSGLKISFAAN